jgi:hypothetical protein
LDVLISFATSCTNSNDSDNLERRFTSAITSFRCKSSCKPQKEITKCDCHRTVSENVEICFHLFASQLCREARAI